MFCSRRAAKLLKLDVQFEADDFIGPVLQLPLAFHH